MAEATFGPLETQRVGRTGERGFYRIWTVREAMGKATGEGLRLVADRLDRAQLDEVAPRRQRLAHDPRRGRADEDLSTLRLPDLMQAYGEVLSGPAWGSPRRRQGEDRGPQEPPLQ